MKQKVIKVGQKIGANDHKATKICYRCRITEVRQKLWCKMSRDGKQLKASNKVTMKTSN